MTWDIKPFVSVGPLRFGESRSAIRETLGGSGDTFEKVPGAIPTDAYDELGVHAHYDKEDRLCLVELFEPAAVTFDSIELLDNDLGTVQRDLEKLGAARHVVDNGIRYDDLGFVLVVMDDQVDGVSVFKNGYFG